MNKNRIPESRDGARHKSPTNRLQPKKLLEGLMESLSPKQRDKLDDLGIWLEDCRYAVRKTCSDVKAGIQYARNGWAKRDYVSFGFNEPSRVANILRSMANNSLGCPGVYLDRENWLNKHEDDYEKWLDSHTLIAILDGDYPEDGRIPTLRELAEKDDTALGNSAWTDDLLYAADVLDEYQKNMCDDSYIDTEIYGHDEAERRRQMIEAKYREVWEWIGKMLPYMND